jgi:prephenate dehydratase
MITSLAHLGPVGTNAETAALVYANRFQRETGEDCLLCPYPSIAQTIQAVAEGAVNLAVVPVENSTEGTLAVTLDRLWQFDQLKIQQELVLPISHALISQSVSLAAITTVYSHPQALAQCQQWLERYLPQARVLAANSTTEALQHIQENTTIAAISAPRAAKLYNLPILMTDIQDYPNNCTRFWVLGGTGAKEGSHISLAFSFPANVPGALVKPLEAFAKRGINLNHIESRPTKRSLGEYLFFMDLEASIKETFVQEALIELQSYTEVLKVFGCYPVINLESSEIEQL